MFSTSPCVNETDEISFFGNPTINPKTHSIQMQWDVWNELFLDLANSRKLRTRYYDRTPTLQWDVWN